MHSKLKIKYIAIVGLGLIGGSLAKALKQKDYKIIGIDSSYKTISSAIKGNTIDCGFTKLSPNTLLRADLVFLATPLNLIGKYIKQIGKFVKHDLILADLGSTKLEICKIAKEVLPANIVFIGGHPMAGSEKFGFEVSDKKLFKNSVWALTPIDKNNKTKQALKLLEILIDKIEGRSIVVTPELHDKAVALISHLPLLSAIALCKLVEKVKDKKLQKLALLLASTGFKDTTRIAGGNFNLNADIISSNFSELEKLIPKYIVVLKDLIEKVSCSDPKLLKEFKNISSWRNKLYLRSEKLRGLPRGIEQANSN